MTLSLNLLAAATAERKQPLCLCYKDQELIKQKGTIFGSKHYTNDLKSLQREIIYLIHRFVCDVMTYKFKDYSPQRREWRRQDLMPFYIYPGNEMTDGWNQEFTITKGLVGFTMDRFLELPDIFKKIEATEINITFNDKGELDEKGNIIKENSFVLTFNDEQENTMYELKILHP